MPGALLAMAGLGLLGAISDATLNRWAESRQTGWLLVSYALWGLVATFFGLFLRTEHVSFGLTVLVFLAVNVAAAVGLDVLLFGGSISRQQWLGVALAAAAVVIIETGRPGES